MDFVHFFFNFNSRLRLHTFDFDSRLRLHLPLQLQLLPDTAQTPKTQLPVKTIRFHNQIPAIPSNYPYNFTALTKSNAFVLASLPTTNMETDYEFHVTNNQPSTT